MAVRFYECEFITLKNFQFFIKLGFQSYLYRQDLFVKGNVEFENKI
jgi:hypothetical protein